MVSMSDSKENILSNTRAERFHLDVKLGQGVHP